MDGVLYCTVYLSYDCAFIILCCAVLLPCDIHVEKIGLDYGRLIDWCLFELYLLGHSVSVHVL